MSTSINEIESHGAAVAVAVQKAADEKAKAAEMVQPGILPPRRGAEYFDTILWRLRAHMDASNEQGFVLGLTGCQQRVGVTTVAANLAIRAADHGVAPALIIDANFRRPRQQRVFKLRKGAGLLDVLSDRASLTDAIRPTKVAGLEVLPMGNSDLRERAGIDRDQLAALVKELRHDYRMIIVDMAGSNDAGHGLLFAEHLDATLLVVRAEMVRRRVAVEQMERLVADHINVIGAVVTGKRNFLPRWMRRNA